MKGLSLAKTALIIFLLVVGMVSLAGGSGQPSIWYFPSHDLPPTLAALAGDAYLDITEQRVGRSRGAWDGLVALGGPAWLLLFNLWTLLATPPGRESLPRRRPGWLIPIYCQSSYLISLVSLAAF